jgi:hypothetical protein
VFSLAGARMHRPAGEQVHGSDYLHKKGFLWSTW